MNKKVSSVEALGGHQPGCKGRGRGLHAGFSSAPRATLDKCCRSFFSHVCQVESVLFLLILMPTLSPSIHPSLDFRLSEPTEYTLNIAADVVREIPEEEFSSAVIDAMIVCVCVRVRG